jgi:hypothetical protein
VPLARLFAAFQPATVVLAIMIAAVLVRLNRGMPTLDWKSLELEKRTHLTSAIVDLTREYGSVIAVNAGLLASIITLTVVGNDEVQAAWPYWTQQGSAAAVGAGAALCICRMAYVIWRDLDIVRLQKHLIDASAARDTIEIETNASSAKIADIRAAALRKITPRDQRPLEE